MLSTKLQRVILYGVLTFLLGATLGSMAVLTSPTPSMRIAKTDSQIEATFSDSQLGMSRIRSESATGTQVDVVRILPNTEDQVICTKQSEKEQESLVIALGEINEEKLILRIVQRKVGAPYLQFSFPSSDDLKQGIGYQDFNLDGVMDLASTKDEKERKSFYLNDLEWNPIFNWKETPRGYEGYNANSELLRFDASNGKWTKNAS